MCLKPLAWFTRIRHTGRLLLRLVLYLPVQSHFVKSLSLFNFLLLFLFFLTDCLSFCVISLLIILVFAYESASFIYGLRRIRFKTNLNCAIDWMVTRIIIGVKNKRSYFDFAWCNWIYAVYIYIYIYIPTSIMIAF